MRLLDIWLLCCKSWLLFAMYPGVRLCTQCTYAYCTGQLADTKFLKVAFGAINLCKIFYQARWLVRELSSLRVDTLPLWVFASSPLCRRICTRIRCHWMVTCHLTTVTADNYISAVKLHHFFWLVEAAVPFSSSRGLLAAGFLVGGTPAGAFADVGLLVGGTPIGGFEVAAAADDGIFSFDANLAAEAVAADRSFDGARLTGLPLWFSTEVVFAGGAAPMLGLGRRTTGGGFVPGLKDWARDTFVRSWSVELSAALLVVRRAAALAELAAEETESQLEVDVLACDETPLVDFLTMNWLTMTTSRNE